MLLPFATTVLLYTSLLLAAGLERSPRRAVTLLVAGLRVAEALLVECVVHLDGGVVDAQLAADLVRRQQHLLRLQRLKVRTQRTTQIAQCKPDGITQELIVDKATPNRRTREGRNK